MGRPGTSQLLSCLDTPPAEIDDVKHRCMRCKTFCAASTSLLPRAPGLFISTPTPTSCPRGCISTSSCQLSLFHPMVPVLIHVVTLPPAVACTVAWNLPPPSLFQLLLGPNLAPVLTLMLLLLLLTFSLLLTLTLTLLTLVLLLLLPLSLPSPLNLAPTCAIISAPPLPPSLPPSTHSPWSTVAALSGPKASHPAPKYTPRPNTYAPTTSPPYPPPSFKPFPRPPTASPPAPHPTSAPRYPVW